jgi:hypothetical protein
MSALVRRLGSLIACLAATAVWASPTFFGDTGLVLAPTADVLPYTHMQFSGTYTRLSDGTNEVKAFPVTLTYGASNNSELSVSFAEASDDSGHGADVKSLGAKVNILTEDFVGQRPGLAAGIRVAKFGSGQFDHSVSDAYFVASKALFLQDDGIEAGFAVRAHLGLGYTSYSGGTSSKFTSVFGGVSFKSRSGHAVIFEILPEHKDGAQVYRERTMSASIRHPLSENFVLEIGNTRPYSYGDETYFAKIIYHAGERLRDDPRTSVRY